MKNFLKSRIFTIFAIFILLCVTCIMILAFSSYTATENTAKIIGGQGTVENPLKIEVSENAGILPFLDSLLPFKGIPCIELSYTGERFYIPGYNAFFSNKQPLAKLIFLFALITLPYMGLCFILKLTNKKLIIVTAEKKDIND